MIFPWISAALRRGVGPTLGVEGLGAVEGSGGATYVATVATAATEPNLELIWTIGSLEMLRP